MWSNSIFFLENQHLYCEECINDWLINRNKETCPYCRENIDLRESGMFYVNYTGEIIESSIKRMKEILSVNSPND